MKKNYILNINGFEMSVMYDDLTVNEVFIPLLKKWTKLYQQKRQRILVFLSAPPGTGKSTVAQFLEYFSQKTEGIEEIQAIGLDGFHYHQDYILTHSVLIDGKEVPMKAVKGCPETYDIEKLQCKLVELKQQDVKWPVYDRNLHDVVEDVTEVTKGIILLEGNWLLSTEGPWDSMISWCDDSVFISAESEFLKERLMNRKIRGGLTREAAEDFYYRSDKVNVERLMKNHHSACTNLQMQADGTYVKWFDLPESVCDTLAENSL